MKLAKTLLLATCVAGLLVAAAPTAQASIFACASPAPGGPGPVGRTLQFVGDTEYYACSEGFGYAIDMCMFVFNPSICLAIA